MLSARARLSMVALSGALTSACAGAPPPDPPRRSTKVVPAPSPEPAETAAPDKPPIPIGVGFQDADEPLPKGAVLRCGTHRMQLKFFEAVAVTDTGQIWAVEHRRSEWTLVDVNRGVEVATLAGRGEAVFSPDASVLVYWGLTQSSLVFFSVPERKVIGTLDLPKPPPPKPRSPFADPRIARSAALRDAAEFGMIGLLSSSSYRSVRDLLVSPDGSALAATTPDHKVHLIDLPSRSLVRSTSLPKGGFLSGMSSAGDRGVIEISDSQSDAFQGERLTGYQVLDLRSGASIRKDVFKKVKKALGGESSVETEHALSAFRISVDGKVLLRREAGVLTFIDVATGNEAGGLDIGASLAASDSGLGADPESPRVSWQDDPGDDETFAVLDEKTVRVGDVLVVPKTMTIKARAPGLLSVSRDGSRTVTRQGRRVHLNPGDPEITNTLSGAVGTVTLTSDNQLVIDATDTRLHHPGSCAAGPSLQENTGFVATAPHNWLALTNREEIAFFHDGQPSSKMPVHGHVLGIHLAPTADRLYVSAGEDGKPGLLKTFPLGAEIEADHVRALDLPLRSTALSQDGTLLAASGGVRHDSSPSRLWLFDAPGLEPVAEAPIDEAGQVEFVGSTLVLNRERWSGIVARRIPKLEEAYRIHEIGCCETIAASPDGRWLAGAAHGGLRIWNAETRQLVGEVSEAHRESIQTLAFSPDSKYVATGSADQTVFVWQIDALTVRPIAQKTETVASGADEAKRFFVSRSDVYSIAASGKLSVRPDRSAAVPPLKSVTLVASGGGAHCAIAESKVRCWGSTANGLLGIPPEKGATKYSYATRTSPTTVPVEDPVDLRMYDGHACALSRKGSLVCWGQIDYETAPRAPAEKLRDVKAFALGRESECAVTTAGDLRCWDEKAITAGMLSGAAAVDIGFAHVCALDGAGTLRCKGANDHDEVGDATGVPRADLVPVRGLQKVTAFAVERWATCAVADSGAWCWGWLGDVVMPSPTRVKSLDGATALRFVFNSICGQVGERVDCVSLSREE